MSKVPSFTATKLLWLKHNEPEAFARVACLLLPAGFVNFFLTGNKVIDVSASRRERGIYTCISSDGPVWHYSTKDCHLYYELPHTCPQLPQLGDASGTGFLDISCKRWDKSETVARLIDVKVQGMLPTVVQPNEVIYPPPTSSIISQNSFSIPHRHT